MLFRSAGEDGSDWLFIILPENRWMITRDRKKIASGSARSVCRGVERFIALTAPASFAVERAKTIGSASAGQRSNCGAAGRARETVAAMDLGVLGASRDIQIKAIRPAQAAQGSHVQTL